MLPIEELHRAGNFGFGEENWKGRTVEIFLKSDLVFRDRIAMFVQRALTGTIINNIWWFALKTAIMVEAIRYSKQLALERVEGEIVGKLEEALSGGDAPNVLAARMNLDQSFNVKHQGCTVRARMRALRNEGVATA